MLWETNYIEHYGVKGQKHGLRRYQNEDGSLTAEGRDHYGVGEARQSGRGSGGRSGGTTAGGIKGQGKKPMSKQQKLRKAYNIMGKALAVTAAAAVVGYGIKNRDKLKDAASMIKNVARNKRPSDKSQSSNPLNRIAPPSKPNTSPNIDRAHRNLAELAERNRQLNEANRRVDEQLNRMNQKYANPGGGSQRNSAPQRNNAPQRNDAPKRNSAPQRNNAPKRNNAPQRNAGSSVRRTGTSSDLERAQRNLAELAERNRRMTEANRRVDEQLNRMNRKYGVRR